MFFLTAQGASRNASRDQMGRQTVWDLKFHESISLFMTCGINIAVKLALCLESSDRSNSLCHVDVE